jgi:hypothetical protein
LEKAVGKFIRIYIQSADIADNKKQEHQPYVFFHVCPQQERPQGRNALFTIVG